MKRVLVLLAAACGNGKTAFDTWADKYPERLLADHVVSTRESEVHVGVDELDPLPADRFEVELYPHDGDPHIVAGGKLLWPAADEADTSERERAVEALFGASRAHTPVVLVIDPQ